MKIAPILTIISLITAVFLFNHSPYSAEQHKNTDTSLPMAKSATMHLESIVLGAGCFWGAEKKYEAIPGVITAISGYADGKNIKATYKEITKTKNRFNDDNHAEVVKVTYNSSIIDLKSILKNYFEGHDPTQLNRQGNDVGTQYRSTILFNNEKQKNIAMMVSNQYQALLTTNGYDQIKTKIRPLTKFFPAEKYHQDYLAKNPNGYCPDHSTGVKFKNDMITKKSISNNGLMQGKQVVVIEADHYCPYCEKFRKNVVNDYRGTIPLSFRLATQLTGLEVKTPTWATPTILFLENGKEVFGRQGYISPKKFYKALGAFKLGKSEAYDVAFNEGTDARYCKEYEIFKNTPDGTFVDKLSGVKLFDTRDRFNSKSGWLSFTKAVDGSVYERKDNRYGMQRIEIRSKSSDIHLGHVFPDGPNGMPRFCINATVLEFVPREAS